MPSTWCLAKFRKTLKKQSCDQGHTHPLLEHPASAVGSEHSSKELFEQLTNNYLEQQVYWESMADFD
jgi:hypothetical protein